MRVNIIGMPPHSWNWGNIEKVVIEAGGSELVEVDKGYLNLDRVDLIKARIKVDNNRRALKPIKVVHNNGRFRVLVTPLVFQPDLS